MIKRLTLICLAAALSGCGPAVALKGQKVRGQNLVTLLSGSTIHGMHGVQNTYYTKFIEKYNSDGSYELTEPNDRGSTTRQDTTHYGKWETKEDRVCYSMKDKSTVGCIFLYADGDYIQYVSISSGKMVAFSTDIEYNRAATNAVPGTPPAPAPTAAAPTAAAPNRKLEPVSSGTGFVVSTETYVLTNAHVVDGCLEVRIKSRHRDLIATVASQDKKNDLALLKLAPEDQPVAVFQELKTLYPGDSVVAVGFPLWGLLASEPNVSVGTVSALAGIRNDTGKLQIAAPIQPGNSGGPLFDKSGLVVGVVVSSLNEKAAFKITGAIPQNVNFAIKSGSAVALMQASGVGFTQVKSTKSLIPSDIARKAREYTVLIECWA